MPEPTRPTGAVFLSYAREDAEAARRIAEALRGFGVEVWFDLSELRGGDAWDAKIRKQIRECTLFIPIISARTQARREGYFRREWNLAVERTLDMSASTAFIVPVLVDDTRESDADVPEQFLKAHCTRLVGGAPTPQFVEQVTRLLQGPGPAGAGTKPTARAPLPSSLAPAKSGLPLWAAALLGLVVIGLVAFLLLRPGPKPEPAPVVSAPAPAAVKSVEPVAAPASAPDSKSIAVLPFIDMSQAKDQEYFSDGLSEELLNLLAKIPALHVTSRSSAFSFKGKSVELSEIAKRLNVAHILEGSVRKSGNKLRITAQLIDARTDTHLWSETYDRPLDDIFTVQDEIAAAVVTQLKLSLLGTAPKAKTFDPNAYALYLQARQIEASGLSTVHEQAIALYQQALKIDPALAPAWTGIADCYLQEYSDSTSARTLAEISQLSRAAINQALAIDPGLADAHARLGAFQLNFENNVPAAARSLEHAVDLDPGNVTVLNLCYFLTRMLGRPGQMVALTEYVAAHDPLSSLGYSHLGTAYLRAGRLDDGIAACRTALRLSPGRSQTHWLLTTALLEKGDPKAALAEIEQEPTESWRLDGETMVYHALGQKEHSDAALATLIAKNEKDASWNIAYIYAQRGEPDRAFEWLEKAITYKDAGLIDTAADPIFKPLHQDPRWLPFLRKIGIAPEQLAEIKFDLRLPGN